MLLDGDPNKPLFCAIAEIDNIARSACLPPPSISKFNRLLNPIGQYPGRGWFLVTRDILNKINVNGLHSVSMQDESPNRKLVANNLVIIKEPYGITPGDTGDTANVFCLEMADQRWVLNDPAMGVACNKYYNVIAVDWNDPSTGTITNFWADSKNGGVTAWTWQTMVTDLWNLCPQLGSNSTLPYTPNDQPYNFSFPGTNAYWALNQVLWKLGCGIRWDCTKTTNQYSIVRIGASDMASDQAITAAENPSSPTPKIHDREFQTIVRGKEPATVTVCFQILYSRGVENTTGIDAAKQYIVNSVYKIPVNSPRVSLADPSTSHVLWDDMPACADASDAITNFSALTARANERGASFFQMLNGDSGGVRLHKIFTQVLYAGSGPFLPGSAYRGVAWGQDLIGLGSGMRGGLITEVVRHPFWCLGVDNEGQWVDYHGDMSSSYLRPVDYGPTDPNYPVHSCRLMVNNTTPEATGLYNATLYRYDNTNLTYSAQENVWGQEMNGATNVAIEKYPCRLVGYGATSLSGRPIWEFKFVAGGNSTPLDWCFEAVAVASMEGCMSSAVTSFLRKTVLTSGNAANYTTGAGTTLIDADLYGAGGGGGGSSATGVSVGGAGAGGGGSSGAHAEWVVPVLPNTNYTYTVGNGGNGGTGGNNGLSGDASRLTVGANTAIATGGTGGSGDPGNDQAHFTGGGNAPTASTNSSVNGSGNPGFAGIVLVAQSGPLFGQTTPVPFGGTGGCLDWGGAGTGNGAGGVGMNALPNTGAGGAGASTGLNGANAVGGKGGSGVIIIHEYGSL